MKHIFVLALAALAMGASIYFYIIRQGTANESECRKLSAYFIGEPLNFDSVSEVHIEHEGTQKLYTGKDVRTFFHEFYQEWKLSSEETTKNTDARQIKEIRVRMDGKTFKCRILYNATICSLYIKTNFNGWFIQIFKKNISYDIESQSLPGKH